MSQGARAFGISFLSWGIWGIFTLGMVGEMALSGGLSAQSISFQDPSTYGQRTYRPTTVAGQVDLLWNEEVYSWKALRSLRGLEEANGQPFLALDSEATFSEIDQSLKSLMAQNAEVFSLGSELDQESIENLLQISPERSRFSGVYKYMTYNRLLEVGDQRVAIDSLYITFRFKQNVLVGFSTSGLNVNPHSMMLHLEPEDAIQIVMEDTNFRRGSGDSFEGKIRLSAKWMNGENRKPIVQPIYILELKKEGSPGIYHFEVSASTGEIVEVASNLHLGITSGDFYERLPGEITRQGLPAVTVRSGQRSELTGSDGSFSLDGPNLLLELQNSSVRVMNANQVLSTLRPQNSDDPIFEAPKYLTDLMAFIHVGRVNTFVKNRLRSIPMINGRDFLTQPITVNTLATRGSAKTCNAWYDPRLRSLNFLPASEKCENSAMISDIIYHEWGHALDDALGGIRDRAFSEAIGDILASLMTGDARLAPGFIKERPEGIRDLRDVKVYPRDKHENPHLEGLIIGGAWYEFTKLMEARYGAEVGRSKTADIFLRHLLSAENYLESYQAALVVDDNDANLGNGTPNLCLFNRAFAKRGLVKPETKCSADHLHQFHKTVSQSKLGRVSKPV